MKSLFVLFLVLLAPIRSYGVISVNIFPAADGQATFLISGQFDGPVVIAGPGNNLASFAFAPMAALSTHSFLNDRFSPSLATITNVTRGGSATITEFSSSIYPEFDFDLGRGPLPLSNGDILSLVPNGPATLTIFATGDPLPYTDFVPGDYLFNNLGSTFAVHIVPEPSLIELAGIGALTLISMRRRTLGTDSGGGQV